MRPHGWRMCLGIVLAAMCLGCSVASPVSAPPRADRRIRYARLGVVEFTDTTPHNGTARQFSQALRRKLAEQSVETDVVLIPRAALPVGRDPFDSGRIPLESLMRMRRDHMVDAVIVGRVDSHNPYRMPSIHLSLKVVDTGVGSIPLEISEGWDAAREAVQAEVDAYYRRNMGRDDCRLGPNVFYISPRYYLSFVADQVADQIIAALGA